ncbi:MAG: G1 family glutamic endopeptidase [Actinomycetes bacterium]
MRCRAAIALAAVLGSGLAVATAHASPPRPRALPQVAAFVPAHPGQVLPRRDAEVRSGNWSGYVVRPGIPVTGVQSTFVVPTAGAVPPGFSSSWAGIGGFGTRDLIQAGTESDTVDGYYAWFEMLPASQGILINCSGDTKCTVRPGDRMGVDIHLVGRNLWSVTVVDSRHWTWRATVSYASSLSSAEWIFEAPTLAAEGVPVLTTVPNVGAAYFGPVSNFTVAGHRHTIAAGHPVKVDMVAESLAGQEATTSGLAVNHQSFRVCTWAGRCAAPAS